MLIRRTTSPASTVVILIGMMLPSGCGGSGDDVPEDPRLQNPLMRTSQFNETAPESFRARFETTAGVFRDRGPPGLGSSGSRPILQPGERWLVRRGPLPSCAEGLHGQLGHSRRSVRETSCGRSSFWLTTRPLGRTSEAVFPSRAADPTVAPRRSSSTTRTTPAWMTVSLPFGEVVEGMDVVGRLYAEYGDGPPRGEGVYQAMAIARGGGVLR